MEKKGRLLELDCLRGVAAMLVVSFHFTLGQVYLKPIFKYGLTGVDLFFVISGFVIFLTIEKTKSYKDFLISRFARLYPAYWTCVTITAVIMKCWRLLAKHPIQFPKITDYLVNLTMLQYYFHVIDIDGVYWTLIVELIFYLFILIFYLIKVIHHIELIGLFILLCCLVDSIVLKSSAPQVYTLLKYCLPILSYFPLFIAGITFYKIKFYKVTLSRCLLIVACLVTQIVLFKNDGRINFISQSQYGIVLVVVFSLFFLYAFNYLGFIVNKALVFLGGISYSLYLIHNYVFSLLIVVLTHSHLFHLNFWVAVIFIVLPAALFMAYLINRFVEIPAMRYLKGRALRYKSTGS